jgi:hypothetical protein
MRRQGVGVFGLPYGVTLNQLLGSFTDCWETYRNPWFQRGSDGGQSHSLR